MRELSNLLALLLESDSMIWIRLPFVGLRGDEALTKLPGLFFVDFYQRLSLLCC